MERIKQKLVVLLAVTFVFAGEVNANPAGSGKDAPAIIADVFICRPLGILALAGGSALYVLTLPFTIPAKGKEAAKRTLVLFPYHYTFTRQLGEFHDEDL
jgi:hypothetical protein